MSHPPLSLALLLAFTASLSLSGCDPASRLTDQEHIQRAKDFEDKGDLKASILELKNAVQKNPDNAQARLLLGQTYLKANLGAEAEKELLKAEKLGVSHESIQVLLGRALLLMGEYKRVLAEVTLSETGDTRNKALITRMHGDANVGLGNVDTGCALYRDALKLDARHVPTYWGLANCALAKRNQTEARQMIDQALRIDDANAETWVVLGDLERLDSKPEAALAAYTSALKHDPSHRGALFRRAQVLVFSGKHEDARKDIEALRKLAPNDFGVPFLDALLQFSTGKSDLALEAVQQSLKLNPAFGPSEFLFALVQYDRKAYEQAAKTLGRYVATHPGHLEARKLLAATYLKLNQPEQALDLLKPYLASDKADPQTLALAGQAHLRENDPARAQDLFQRASELVPQSAFVRTMLGMSRLAAGEEAAAVRELQASSAMPHADPKADIALAYHFLGEQRFDDALTAIAKLEKKLPDSPGTHNLKGMAYLGKGDRAQARKSFERALALKPDLVSAAVRLASLDLQEKNLAAAKSRYESILKADPKSVPAMVGMAEVAAQEKKTKDFVGWLEKAVKTSPTAIVPRAYLADYHLSQKQPQQALAVAREAANAAPASVVALGLLGRMQLAAGQEREAVATYTKLVAMAPQSAPAQLELAKAHAAAGDERATRAALRKSLEIKPDYTEGLATLSKLETRTGNPDEGVKLARHLQASNPKSHLGFELEGDARMAQKRYAEAGTAYEKALALAKDSKVMIKRHHALLKSGDAKKADQLMLGWLTQNPQDRISRAYLAGNFAQRGLNQQAIAQYQDLLSAVPNNPVVLNNLALVYQKEKDPRALALAEKAYKLDPDNPAYADTLGWILVERGKTSPGLQLLEKAARLQPRNLEIRLHLASALAQAGQTARARQEIAEARKFKLSPELEQLARRASQQLP